MGNSLEAMETAEEWAGLDDEVMEGIIQPLERGEAISHIAEGIKTVIEVASVASIAAMQLIRRRSTEEAGESDSDETEGKKNSEEITEELFEF
jgi:coenzyme F420-reducing hydrogenase gamma subunit